MKRLSYKVNGKEMPYVSISIKESFNLLCCEVTMILYQDPKDSVVTVQDQEFKQVKAVSRSNGTVSVTFWPKIYMDLMQKEFPCMNKQASLEQVLDQYGIPYTIKFKTTPIYWCISSSKILGFLNIMKNRVTTSGGGGTVMTFGFNNKLRVIDLKKAYEADDTIAVCGKKSLISRDLQWLTKIPGTYQVDRDSIETPRKTYKLEFAKNLSTGPVRQFFFNEKSLDSFDQEMTNIFYRSFYTSQFWKYENILLGNEVYLGAVVIDPDTKQKSVVWEMEIVGTLESFVINLLTVSKP